MPVKSVINGFLFQIGWFACVLGGDAVAMPVLAIILVIHGYFFLESKREWSLVAIVTVVGLLVDGMLAWTGIYTFETASLLNTPVWLACIWALFACTFNHSLKWLQSRLLLAAILGAVAGPLSYLAGSRMAPVVLADPVIVSILVMSICWALVLPLLMMLARRSNLGEGYAL